MIIIWTRSELDQVKVVGVRYIVSYSNVMTFQKDIAKKGDLLVVGTI